jgi:ubiquinone/menaquinone biosynthesis C-methylase UbiE
MLRLWRGLVRLGFRLLYYELAWSYDLVAWLVSMGQWRAWGRAALPYVVGRRVLEIGHGPGHLLLALHEAGYSAVGLDLSPQMGRLARNRTGGAVPLLRGRVQELPLATAVFHTVLSTFPTEYMVDPATLAAVKRVLGENGRFLIIPVAHLTGRGLPQRFIEWLYAITGQRANQPATALPDSAAAWQPYLDRFAAAGFRVDIQTIALPKSHVTLLIADVVGLQDPKGLPNPPGLADSPDARPPDTMRP